MVALGITAYEALYQPYMACQLAASCPMKAEVFGYSAERVQADMGASRQPCGKHGQPYIEWLRSVLPPSEAAAGPAPDAPAAVDGEGS